MKKIIIVIASLLLLLTGCGSNASSSSNEVETKKKDELENIYGTWTMTRIKHNDSFYTIEELEALGDDGCSDVYFVFKEGGTVFGFNKGQQELSNEWKYDEKTKTVSIGVKELNYENGELILKDDESTFIYLTKYSDSQDITEIPKEEEVKEETNITEETKEETQVNSDEIRPEVKEAIDAYETYVDEYCAFMKKYIESNGNDLSLYADYAKFVSKLADMGNKMEDLEGDLTDAEAKYYAEVMLRCSNKLVEVAINQ